MTRPYSNNAVAFIRSNYPVVNAIYADTLLHNLGATSYVAKARILGTVEPDHVHQGSRYWRTSALIDAYQHGAS